MADGTKTFGGFESLSDTFLRSDVSESTESFTDPEDIKRNMESLDDKVESKQSPAKNTKPTTEEVDDEDNSEEETEEGVDNEEEGEVDEIDENTEKQGVEDYDEETIVDAFSDLFAAELDWKFEDDKKPKNIKDLVNYMKDIIEENSQPVYSNDQVKELDEFVKNGGDIKDFISKVYTPGLDLSKLDLTKEDHQKTIIKENLRNRGYSDTRIEKLISRYEEADSLEEEAEESMEEVKEYVEKSKQTLLETQKKQQADTIKQQQAFVQNVEKTIKDTNEIQGFTLNEKEKKKLLDDIFKIGSDGLTNYQREYNKNQEKSLVESAFYHMNKDKIKKQFQTQATTDATKQLKLKLKSKGQSTKNTASEIEKDSKKVSKLWDIASELRTF